MLYTKIVNRANLKCSHHMKKFFSISLIFYLYETIYIY